ncbi:MAG: hypothetical protein HN370_02865 [Phycisphaerales bacterium]|nr:hypothetical protein [Phycisphaerales bacterium]
MIVSILHPIFTPDLGRGGGVVIGLRMRNDLACGAEGSEISAAKSVILGMQTPIFEAIGSIFDAISTISRATLTNLRPK